MDRINAFDHEIRGLLVTTVKSPTSIVEYNSIIFSPRPEANEKVSSESRICHFDDLYLPFEAPASIGMSHTRRSSIDLEFNSLSTKSCENQSMLEASSCVSVKEMESSLSSLIISSVNNDSDLIDNKKDNDNVEKRRNISTSPISKNLVDWETTPKM